MRLDDTFNNMKQTHAQDFANIQVSLETIGERIGSSRVTFEVNENGHEFEEDNIFPIKEKAVFDDFEHKLRIDQLYRTKMVRFQ